MQNILIIAGVVIIGGVAAVYLLGSNDASTVTQEIDLTPTYESDETTDVMAESEVTVQEPDIVDTAIASDDFNTLVAAVSAAGLVDTLKSSGPFTVFAPTDAAFAALPDGTLDTLLEPANIADLTGVLTYHVVPGAVISSQLSDGMVVETVSGEELTIGVTAAGVTVNGALVTTADIETSNGVIHVIDEVLLPPTE